MKNVTVRIKLWNCATQRHTGKTVQVGKGGGMISRGTTVNARELSTRVAGAYRGECLRKGRMSRTKAACNEGAVAHIYG